MMYLASLAMLLPFAIISLAFSMMPLAFVIISQASLGMLLVFRIIFLPFKMMFRASQMMALGLITFAGKCLGTLTYYGI
jgi:hypothetical protein